MDKMRWFIIGNLIGFAVLIGGIALNDSFRQNSQESSSSDNTSSDNRSSYSKNVVSPSATTTDSTRTSAAGATPQSQRGTTPSSSPPSTNVNPVTATSDSQTTSGKNDAPTGIEFVTRVVTARDISKGTILHPGDIELRKIDEKRARPNGLNAVESAFGRKTRIDLIEGEMLEPGDLDKP